MHLAARQMPQAARAFEAFLNASGQASIDRRLANGPATRRGVKRRVSAARD
jgi:hypothetical protein